MKYFLFSLALLSIFALAPVGAPDAMAGETVVYEVVKSGRVLQGARMRAGTSTSSDILRVLAAGTVVEVKGIEHGWYRIAYAGEVGYTATWLIELTNDAPTGEKKTEEPVVRSTTQSGTYLYWSRVRADRSTAAETLDTLAPGTRVNILEQSDGWYQVKLSDGRVGWSADWLLSVAEDGGQKEVEKTPATKEVERAATKRGRYLYRSNVRSAGSAGASVVAIVNAGTEADILEATGGWYRVRFSNGTEGWSADWLIQTIEKTAVMEPANNTVVTGTVHEPIQGDARAQQGTVPSGVDLVALNNYWLQKINALRAERGLRQLVLDQRWVETAAEYVAYMGQTGATNHERADGSSMHDWIDAKNLAFTERHSDGGWQTNYFTENISWGYADGTTESVKGVLDRSLEFFLGEASYNGSHYRTIYHADWNSVGLGFYFAPAERGRYKVSVAYHYGSLEM